MDISLADNCVRGFREWPDADQPDGGNNRHDDGGAALAAADTADPVMTPLEQPHRPWLVPGAGRL